MSAACRLSWCRSRHEDDTATTVRHSAVLDRQIGTDTTVSVFAHWAERHDGRGVLPHLTVDCVSATDAHDVDLTLRDAVAWSAILSALDAPWLAGVLRDGAAMLAPHDDQGHDGEPNYVAEDAAERTGIERFRWGLVIEVFDVLERYGYRKASDTAGGRAVALLGDLVDVYEGGQR